MKLACIVIIVLFEIIKKHALIYIPSFEKKKSSRISSIKIVILQLKSKFLNSSNWKIWKLHGDSSATKLKLNEFLVIHNQIGGFFVSFNFIEMIASILPEFPFHSEKIDSSIFSLNPNFYNRITRNIREIHCWLD